MSGIIYVSTRAEVEKLSTYLTDNEIDNVIYHGGLGKKREMKTSKNSLPMK